MSYKRISPIPVIEGGTGNITLTTHGVLIGEGTSAITAITAGTNGQVLVGASAADPAFATLTSSSLTYTTGAGSLAINITAPVSIANGGTNATTMTTTDGTIYFDGTRLVTTATGTAGQFLTSNGAGVAPTYQTAGGASISITGDTGGALTSGSFTFTGGTTGLSFGGSGSTETLTFAGITANGGTVSLATDATTSSLNIGTGAGVKTTVLGSTNSTSATTVQSGTGALNITSTNGAQTHNSGTGALGISTDSSATTVSIATGAAVKTVTLGSTNTTSVTTVACGTGGANFGTSANAHATVIGSTTAASTTTIQAPSAGVILTGVQGVAVANKNYVTINTATGAIGSDAGASSSISITGDTGGALTGSSFTFTGGTTGLSFGGSGSTETLTFAGITANGGTVSLATDATTSTINVGTGAGVKTSTFGSTNTTSTTTIQSGSNALTLTTNGGNANIVLTPNGSGVVTTANNFRAASISFDGGTNLLQNYVNITSWTPAISFGGGTTGITYSTQTGQYSRIGNVVFFRILITLSNKGSSTGNAAITGWPIAAANENDIGVAYFTALTLTALYTGVFIQLNGSSSSIFQIGSAQSVTNVTNTNFANGTTINLTGSYFAA